MKNQKKVQAQALLEQKKQGGRTQAFFNTGTRWMEDKSKYTRKRKHRRQEEPEGVFYLPIFVLGDVVCGRKAQNQAGYGGHCK